QVLEGLVHLGAELDLLSVFEHTSPAHIEGELGESIDQGTHWHRALASWAASSDFWRFFGVVSLLAATEAASLFLPSGIPQVAGEQQSRAFPHRADSSKAADVN